MYYTFSIKIFFVKIIEKKLDQKKNNNSTELIRCILDVEDRLALVLPINFDPTNKYHVGINSF